MQINTVKELENIYLVNGVDSVPKDSNNTNCKEVLEWISNGGVVDPQFTSIELKAAKISEIKTEAYRRITATYPDYKQRNLNGAVSFIQNKEVLSLKAGSGNYTPTADEMTSLRAAKTCKDFIDGIRTKSNQLEVSLDSMTEEQLNAFDPSEDSNWE